MKLREKLIASKRKFRPFIMGLIIGVGVNYLIIPGFEHHNILLHAVSAILLALLFTAQIIYIKTIEWEKSDEQRWKEWEIDHERYFKKFKEMMERKDNVITKDSE